MNSKQLAIERAISFLLARLGENLTEAMHTMVFPHAARLSMAGKPVSGNVFQRAIVTDALLDARDHGLAVDHRVFALQLEKLISARVTDVRGGWRYFPSLYELPPDADDLGLILQVLTRSGCGATSALCDDAIQLLLEQGSREDGALSTWIYDAGDPSPSTQAIMGAIHHVWGTRRWEPEVVANVLYGLALYDVRRFDDKIHRGLEFVEKTQAANGSWICTWYAGPYYGTYVCCRLLRFCRPESACLERALGFIMHGQDSRGRWEDPLSSALALLAAHYASPNRAQGAVARGEVYLMETQQADGGWEAEDFIQVVGVSQVPSYGSRTVTTAYGLKALLCSM